jgi:hypothetical protein
MQTIRKLLLVLTVASIAILGQDKAKIDKITVSVADPEEPALHPATCQLPTYGYLHLGTRTDLTPQEIGEYVVSALADGKVVTIHPPSKSGVYAYADCPNYRPTAVP